jgi:hypothetical protein
MPGKIVGRQLFSATSGSRVVTISLISQLLGHSRGTAQLSFQHRSASRQNKLFYHRERTPVACARKKRRSIARILFAEWLAMETKWHGRRQNSRTPSTLHPDPKKSLNRPGPCLHGDHWDRISNTLNCNGKLAPIDFYSSAGKVAVAGVVAPPIC